jgi:hypothetical protein
MLKRTLAATVAAVLLAAGGLAAAPAAQAAHAKPKKFANCTQMHKKFPGGVAKNKHAKNTKTVGGKKVLAESQYRPKIGKKWYKLNKGLDRDHDKIACEA